MDQPIDQQIYPKENISLGAETRVWLAIYLLVLNRGVVTQEGVLLTEGIDIKRISLSAEVSFSYALRTINDLRKGGLLRNRKDGRLLLKLDKLEEKLTEKGAPID